jgi:aminoglycoside phosphotransferase (APT) family kinase protein
MHESADNLLFETRDGHPLLTGVLDFESAWAGVAESDLAPCSSCCGVWNML